MESRYTNKICKILDPGILTRNRRNIMSSAQLCSPKTELKTTTKYRLRHNLMLNVYLLFALYNDSEKTAIVMPIYISVKYLLFFALIQTYSSFGQFQLDLQNYLTNNYFLVHPAMAGAQLEGVKVNDTSGAVAKGYQTHQAYKLSMHTVASDKIGIGTVFITTKWISKTSWFLTYAYHINLILGNRDIHQLSFGISAGLINNTHDQTQFAPDLLDPLVQGKKMKSNGFHGLWADLYSLSILHSFDPRNLIFKGKNISDNIG